MSFIKPVTIEELKSVQAKILFSLTDKVSKVSDGSVINGLLFGNSKIGQKALKDIAISHSRYFPDSSNGEYLDEIAKQYGVPLRFGALGSSTFIRLVGVEGTFYDSSNIVVSGLSGILFNLEEDITIGVNGFAYVKVSSQSSGSNTNVEPYSLNDITNPPTGHEYVINEYYALGGRDVESDTEFRNRLKDSFNIVATGTLSKIEQVLILLNPKVLRIFNNGMDNDGKLSFSVVSQNGADFTDVEFDALIVGVSEFLSMSEHSTGFNNNIGLKLLNIVWHPIDLGFRAKINANFDVDEIRKKVQIRVNKYLDYRTWEVGQRVEWDDLLQIIKNTEGVEYVPDNFFTPNVDIQIDYGKLPRIRGFEMRDLAGDIISTAGSELNPIFYPNSVDFNFIKSILRTL